MDELNQVERPSMDVDVVCVGFGPAAGGFLTTLSRRLADPEKPALESQASPGMPLQVICYERADDIGFGVSGIVTRARAIRQSFPDLDPAQIPMAAPVGAEKVLYLLDPHGASRRSATLKAADAGIRGLRALLPVEHDALALPWTPGFLHKTGGVLLSMGQFTQWVGNQVMATGAAMVMPGSPVAAPLLDGDRVVGVRMADQGVDKAGRPEDGLYAPGMDVKARLTVVADGPVGPVGRALDARFGMPEGHHVRDWAVGLKAVIELPEGVDLAPGTVLHTFGYPEPEIFGFLYVHPDRLASVGIFVPSWLDCPVRTGYRYLQHFLQHPYLWRYLKGGTLRSFGAKSIQEAGRRGEPHLAGHGYARIGEGSGSTNVLTMSGVDEAWATGVLLAEGVIELLEAGKEFTKENLDAAYVARRRASWLDRESIAGEKARDGFQQGVVTGLLGMALSGMTGGKLNLGTEPEPTHARLGGLAAYYEGRIPADEVKRIREECLARGSSFHDALMDRLGWPKIELDGQLLVTHQDALLVGGKVQATPGFADHVVFVDRDLCRRCEARTCIEICSGQAIAPGEDGLPAFDREKCVHCGACLWNCSQPLHGEQTNIEFRAGAGGLHSSQN
jgi:electron-transferring-flavoprotein dehydrogenase